MFYGNICPAASERGFNEEYIEIVEEMNRTKKRIKSLLADSEELSREFERLYSLWNMSLKIKDRNGVELFKEGYRLGVSLTFEGLNPPRAAKE